MARRRAYIGHGGAGTVASSPWQEEVTFVFASRPLPLASLATPLAWLLWYSTLPTSLWAPGVGSAILSPRSPNQDGIAKKALLNTFSASALRASSSPPLATRAWGANWRSLGANGGPMSTAPTASPPPPHPSQSIASSSTSIDHCGSSPPHRGQSHRHQWHLAQDTMVRCIFKHTKAKGLWVVGARSRGGRGAQTSGRARRGSAWSAPVKDNAMLPRTSALVATKDCSSQGRELRVPRAMVC